jgi:hypothetical protein
MNGGIAVMPEVHVYIPRLAHDQVIHIHVAGDEEPVQDISTQPARDEHNEHGGDDSTVEGMLAIMEARSSASPRLRSDLSTFQEIGYELGVPKLRNGRPGAREPYIRLRDPAVPGHDAGYVRAGWLHLIRRSDRDRLASLPGAHITGSYAKFPLDGKSDLRAARLVKR